MLDQLARRAFFRFEVPIHYMAKAPRVDGDIEKWNERYFVPPLVELEDQVPIADVYWGWNEDFLAVAFDVTGGSGRPEVDTKQWWKQDGVRICVDTRDTRENKRATRYCHFFYVLPVGGGTRGKQPVVGMHRMSRAKEPPASVDLTQIKAASWVDKDGYWLEVLIPAACLHGWDPVEHPRIGIFYKVKDRFVGGQHLTADDELGWNVDPSTWATGVLHRAGV